MKILTEVSLTDLLDSQYSHHYNCNNSNNIKIKSDYFVAKYRVIFHFLLQSNEHILTRSASFIVGSVYAGVKLT